MDDFRFLHDSFSELSFKTTDFSNESLPQIVLIEDDQVFAKTVKRYLEKTIGLKVDYFKTPSQYMEKVVEVPKKSYCIITDISFSEGGVDGLLLVDMLRDKGHSFVSIVMTGFASIETAIAATKKGVFQYLTKPFELEILSELVSKALIDKLGVPVHLVNRGQRKRPAQSSLKSSVFFNKFKIEPPKKDDICCGMIGRSIVMQELFEKILKVAKTDSTVLITGYSGTGKELVSNAIHSLSSRGRQRKVSVNCAAIPSELLESELFGHVEGAFTGAVSNKLGRFVLADKGTIFLDEIGDMPLMLQVKILRVLQNAEIEPVGSTKTTNVDIRIITATNKNLEMAVSEGKFREDLFYRLNVIPIRVPALAERREDIPLLISFFLSRFVSADGRNKIEFDDESLELIMGYDWPGNVRELENLIERLVILKGGSTITSADLPAKFYRNRPNIHSYKNLVNLPDEGIDLKLMLSDLENSLIVQALDRTSGNKNQASKLLQMNRTTLIEKMKKKSIFY